MNVLLVVGDAAALTGSDTTLRTRLQTTLGHAVTLVSDHDAAPNLSGTQAVVFAPSCNNNAISAKYDNAPCGVFAMGVEPHSAFTGGSYAGNGGGQYDFEVVAAGDPLLGGQTGIVELLSGPPSENFTYFEDGGLTTDVVQVLKRNTIRVALARAPQGAIVFGGVRLPTRRVFFTPNEGWPQLFSTAAWTIFDNAVAYIGAAPGQFPTANAGLDQEVETGDVVQLNGSASSDPDGTIQTYTWRVISNSGPAITLSSTTTANPTFTAPATACTIVLGLVVRDNHADQLKSTEDTVRIDVVSHLVVRYAQGGLWIEKPVYAAKNGSWY
ncbi:MAG TPA: PKD domain-containing protein [Candidatus Saccharimonadales bacterium]|nr:PKD domain-containing protein [Candidatus Saccharimonadales bacterium]